MVAVVASDRPNIDPDTIGVVFPFDALDGPGTYICTRCGHLLRIPAGDATADRWSTLRGSNPVPRTATKISADPRLSPPKARMLAGSLGLRANF